MVSVPVPFFFRPPNIVARFFPVWTTSSPRTATVSVSQAAGLSRAPCVSLLIVDLGRGEAVQTTNEGSLAVPGYQGWTACNRNAKEGRLCLSAALDVRFGCMRFAGRFAGVCHCKTRERQFFLPPAPGVFLALYPAGINKYNGVTLICR